MLANIDKSKLEKGISVLNTVIGNSMVNTDNKFLTITNVDNELVLVGFGLNRQISHSIGELEGELEDGEILYQIKTVELSKALPFIETETIEFHLDNKEYIELKADTVELQLINQYTEGIESEIDYAIEKIQTFIDDFTIDAEDYIARLGLVDKMIVVGNSDEDDITVSKKYMYTNMPNVPIDSRLEIESEEDYRLDKATVKTILEMAKGVEDLTEVSLLVDDSEEEFLIGIGDSKYILGELDTYFTGKDEIYEGFDKQGEITLPYKPFIKYLKLSTIYLDNLTEVYLEVKDGIMEILPDSAFVGTTLVSNNNVQRASYSKAELDVMSENNLTIRVTGNIIVQLLSNLTDVADIDNFVMEYGDDSVKFIYEFGETVLGANIELGDD